ncbi:hypothetical protein [Luteimonas terricola]|uniref:hypothetical protein n=1 Tax=Luteimonas terricola TaxID=645597 RepID=UPI001A9DACFA|nr:hypothetical protein [Luteimonas terricola]
MVIESLVVADDARVAASSGADAMFKEGDNASAATSASARAGTVIPAKRSSACRSGEVAGNARTRPAALAMPIPVASTIARCLLFPMFMAFSPAGFAVRFDTRLG